MNDKEYLESIADIDFEAEYHSLAKAYIALERITERIYYGDARTRCMFNKEEFEFLSHIAHSHYEDEPFFRAVREVSEETKAVLAGVRQKKEAAEKVRKDAEEGAETRRKDKLAKLRKQAEAAGIDPKYIKI